MTIKKENKQCSCSFLPCSLMIISTFRSSRLKQTTKTMCVFFDPGSLLFPFYISAVSHPHQQPLCSEPRKKHDILKSIPVFYLKTYLSQYRLAVIGHATLRGNVVKTPDCIPLKGFIHNLVEFSHSPRHLHMLKPKLKILPNCSE